MHNLQVGHGGIVFFQKRRGPESKQHPVIRMLLPLAHIVTAQHSCRSLVALADVSCTRQEGSRPERMLVERSAALTSGLQSWKHSMPLCC